MLKKLALITITLSIIYLLFFSPVFKIKNIESNSTCVQTRELLESTQLAGKNIFLTSKSKIEENVKAKFACAQTVNATKKYPNSISLNITQEEVVAQVEGSDLYLTADALAVKLQTDKKYPKIFLPQEIKISENNIIEDEKVKFALTLLKNIQSSDFTSTQLRFLESADIVVYSQAEATAIFTTVKDVQSQVDSLQSVLSKAKIDPAKIEKIDLRFDKPVVTYKKQ